MAVSFPNWVGNTVEKGEIAPFPTGFSVKTTCTAYT